MQRCKLYIRYDRKYFISNFFRLLYCSKIKFVPLHDIVAACKDKKLPTGVKCGLTCSKLAEQNRCSKKWKEAGAKKCVNRIKSWMKNKKVSATCLKSCKICGKKINIMHFLHEFIGF